MKKAKIASMSALPLLIAGALWLIPGNGEGAESEYRMQTVEVADLQSSVSATGTVSAVTTVQVGTQVSGQVTAIYVDYNDRVEQGQLLARIDPTLAQQSVREAQASLSRVRAELEQAQRTYDRNAQLHEQQVVTDSELETSEYQLEVARASVLSAGVALERAQRNLGYTEIHAPIDGVVVERNVDVGQTVAASLSAPQLFLIAQDLSELEILAAVDESDIAQIHQGQQVEFTVQAYPNEVFAGTVKQVRLQSTTQENVVSYTAVVAAANATGKLLPGMTATVEFVTASARNAYTVPNSALRFRPSEEVLRAAFQEVAGAGDAPRRQRMAAAVPDVAQPNRGLLWYLEDGQPKPLPVTTGISDGQRTVIEGEGLHEGMQIIAASTSSSGAAEPPATNPLSGGQQRPSSGPPVPGGF